LFCERLALSWRPPLDIFGLDHLGASVRGLENKNFRNAKLLRLSSFGSIGSTAQIAEIGAMAIGANVARWCAINLSRHCSGTLIFGYDHWTKSWSGLFLQSAGGNYGRRGRTRMSLGSPTGTVRLLTSITLKRLIKSFHLETGAEQRKQAPHQYDSMLGR